MNVSTVKCADESRRRLRRLAEEHGWSVTHEGARMQPTGFRNRPDFPIARMSLEKTVDAGLVRVVVSWQRNRFDEALMGLHGTRVAYIVQSVGRLRELICDPGAGFVPRTEQVAS